MSKTKYIGYRPTWVEVNLGNLRYNLNQIKRLLAPKTKVLVSVKADAYGHGLIPVAKRLVSQGVDYLGVASIDEGIRLRQEKINLPILVLGMVLKKDLGALFKYNLTPTICTEDIALALNKIAGSRGKSINIHIKIDTGMGRLGVLCEEAPGFIKKLHCLRFINIQGVFTHLACADINKKFTLYQLRMFRNLISRLSSEGIHIPLVHTANSLGVVNYRMSHFNMIRPGLVIYGLYPQENLGIRLKPVLSLKTKIVYFKRVPSGFGISYGHTYVTRSKATIVTLPIGYGDGYPRNLSNKAEVLIRGRRFRISGRVCMDQIMVDVKDLAVKIGDEVVLIGSQGKDKITVEELANLSGTIPYEIVCGLGNRLPRIYNH
ncbi:MAG: alanine racemase [Candidatus Omnitrophica bacterium]|nr:alanine racemase [Candidatus Omnitrophota bacterium]MBU4473113.1 alanine racemase [Candidatus Omnitrophota bacterium]